MADAAQLPPRLARIPALRFVLMIAAAALVVSAIAEVAPGPVQLARGLPDLARLLDRMWPPTLEPGFLWRIAARIVETLQIALAGAAVGIVLSLPVAWLAARSISPVPRLAFLCRGIVSLLRTVPDLVWALIFVATVGLGPVAGTLTIAVDTIGFCGRFFAEGMEDVDRDPQEALAAHGATRLSILLGAVLPQAGPALINTSLFSLEKAVRSSVVLGLVGAGGIGQELQVAFDLFQYPNAATIILAIFLIVLVIEFVTDRLRRMAS